VCETLPRSKNRRARESGNMVSSTLIELGSLTVHNIEQVKLLNSVVFPGVKYSKKLYDDQLTVDEFAKMAFFDKIFVGAVCCRFEPLTADSPAPRRLYILSLGILAPYRRRGVASALCDHIVKHAGMDDSIENVFLHVKTTNDEAIGFYEAQGFKRKEVLKGYYSNIDRSSPDALVLEFQLDHASGSCL